jgi:hypothetical protein
MRKCTVVLLASVSIYLPTLRNAPEQGRNAGGAEMACLALPAFLDCLVALLTETSLLNPTILELHFQHKGAHPERYSISSNTTTTPTATPRTCHDP